MKNKSGKGNYELDLGVVVWNLKKMYQRYISSMKAIYTWVCFLFNFKVYMLGGIRINGERRSTSGFGGAFFAMLIATKMRVL